MHKELKVWGRELSLKIIFDVFDGEDILIEQHEALDAFLAQASELLADSKAIEEYCVKNSNGSVVAPVDNLFKYVIPTAVYVRRKTDLREIALLCDFKFDEESGCALVFQNEALTKICSQEEL